MILYGYCGHDCFFSGDVEVEITLAEFLDLLVNESDFHEERMNLTEEHKEKLRKILGPI